MYSMISGIWWKNLWQRSFYINFSMEHSNDDIHAIRAITQLRACGEAVADITGAIRFMLDDVMVASGGAER